MQDNLQNGNRKTFPVWIDCYKKLLEATYRKDEIILLFDKRPDEKTTDELKKSFQKDGITAPISIRECKDCGSGLKYVQLWKAKDIHTLISTEGVRATSSPTTETHGEKYSLNFINNLPFDSHESRGEKPDAGDENNKGKNEILIAVLDTGVDEKLVNSRYLWKNDNPNDSSCYQGAVTGWNFTNDTPGYFDDNPSKHGSIITQFIINQFKTSQKNYVRLIPLKTHDKNGEGDLFGIICAIHFAIAKKVKLINASWGFYCYTPFPNEYLKELITKILKVRGILFITAAGNQVPSANDRANKIYSNQWGTTLTDDELRNIEKHNFYPACLSFDDNTVISATTTYKETVSPTQNYSETFVDMGVDADKLVNEHSSMKFKAPFPNSNSLISGSSFATAIATGLIGANCDAAMFNAATAKTDFINKIPNIITDSLSLKNEFIKKGRYVRRQ